MKPLLFAAFLGTMALATEASAQTYLINTATEYSTGTQNFSNAATTGTAAYDYSNPGVADGFRTVSPAQLVTGTNVNPFSSGATTGYTSVVYGGYQIDTNGTTGQTAAPGAAGAPGFRLATGPISLFQLYNSDAVTNVTASMSVAGNFYVPKANFLTGNGATNLTLQGLSFTTHVSTNRAFNAAQTAYIGMLYFTVENGSNWYVSSTVYTSGSAGTFSLADAYNATYYAYDPSTNMLFNSTAPGTAVSGTTLMDVQAVGLLGQALDFNGTANAASGNSYFLNFDSFQVLGVPEPSTIALGLVGLTGLGFLTRRRRSQLRAS